MPSSSKKRSIWKNVVVARVRRPGRVFGDDGGRAGAADGRRGRRARRAGGLRRQRVHLLARIRAQAGPVCLPHVLSRGEPSRGGVPRVLAHLPRKARARRALHEARLSLRLRRTQVRRPALLNGRIAPSGERAQ